MADSRISMRSCWQLDQMHHFRGLISKLSSSASKERLKEEHYLKNGSAVLEEFIALCDGKCRIPLRYFSATEIERATKDAKNRVIFIGRRYMVKGLLDKRRVLVSFTDYPSNRNSSYICRDIAVTSQMSHLKNVLKLIGCCLEYAEPVMVYEYVQEAITLHDLLVNSDRARNLPVPWGSRLRIANEIASTIVYLHSEFNTPIIFRDLHSQKLLIDQSSGVAKLFDFSFSVSLPPGKLEVEAQDGVCGTSGHADPEYCCSECNVMDIADPAILAGEHGIHEIQQQLEDYLDLVKRCISSKGDDRPYMIYVAKELRRIEKCFRALST